MPRKQRNFNDAVWQEMSIEEGPGSVPLGADKFQASAVNMKEVGTNEYNPCAGDSNLLNVAYNQTQGEAAYGKALTHKLWVWAFWFAVAGVYAILAGPNTLGEDSTKARWNVTNETTNVVTTEIVPVFAYPQNIAGLVLLIIALACALIGMFFVEASPGIRMFGCRLCGCNGCNYPYFLFNDLTCGLGGICCREAISEADLVEE